MFIYYVNYLGHKKWACGYTLVYTVNTEVQPDAGIKLIRAAQSIHTSVSDLHHVSKSDMDLTKTTLHIRLIRFLSARFCSEVRISPFQKQLCFVIV